MNTKKNKIIFHILDFIFLMASYMLCDYIADKTNLFIGIIVGLISYIIIVLILCKTFKIDNNKY